MTDRDDRVQMYNLGGEYPDLPTRLLAWPDFCTQVARAEAAEARADPITEALRELTDQVTRYLLIEYPDGHQAQADRPALVLSAANVQARAALGAIPANLRAFR